MRSSDGGVSWTQLGRICMHTPYILSVDFTAIPADGGGIALYFVDMKLLHQAAGVKRIIYRAISRNGVNFDRPQPVVSADVDMFDPAVIRMPNGQVRLYVPMEGVLPGIASFISADGLHFARESGTRDANGSMPGALVLADGRVRIFTGYDLGAGQAGIVSYVSQDGLSFTLESGLRIPAASPKLTEMISDPSPVHLLSGGYLMAFMVNPTQQAIGAEYRLASSEDGLHWNVRPTVFATGGTSCLVEASDGTLYFYYGV
jgi:hypothetical protein